MGGGTRGLLRRAAFAPPQDADVRARALHILPPLSTESHKCAGVIHITARVCAAPASNGAVRANPYRTVFVWTNALVYTSDKSAQNHRNHTPKTRHDLVPDGPGK